MTVESSSTSDLDSRQLEHFIVAWERFGRAARRAQGRANQAPSGTLSHAQYLLVEPLLDEQPMAVCQLAEAAGIAQPTATRMLARLVRDGVLRRRADAGDRRVRLIELTADGQTLVADKRAQLMVVRRQIFASVPEQQRVQARKLLDHLAVAIEQL
ncbi:MAG: MarR family winged helix-turn-helix transcriptional regulator [Solirubrobacteraceae bacterium]